ncbi:Short-chain dehydrogenase/reductase family protein [Mycena venus]|uniref:Short-chain dehydrogenase/reductase family protein n=1 Tax=Mycena venus TaxID=2733690 RepID=A0A8H6X2H4_9AGAR|nr:Short-chain dehydrogenase/reductase family protein [Mycena venus]
MILILDPHSNQALISKVMLLPTISSSTTGEEAATVLAGEIQGKNVLITGTSMGSIGFETARVISKHANLVIIAGYSPERLKLSEDAIKENPSASIRSLVVDLSSLGAVRKAAAEVNAYPEPLHALINNAAAPIGPFKLTVDNLESQTTTDFIGPFLFTKLLTPKLLAAGTASYVSRAVSLSSTGHSLISTLDLNTIVGKPDQATYHPFNVYSHAKAANTLLAIELSKRSDVTLTCCLDRTVVAAFDRRLNDKPGAYLSNGAEANNERAAHSLDPANGEKLWTQTEQIIGEKFTF